MERSWAAGDGVNEVKGRASSSAVGPEPTSGGKHAAGPKDENRRSPMLLREARDAEGAGLNQLDRLNVRF